MEFENHERTERFTPWKWKTEVVTCIFVILSFFFYFTKRIQVSVLVSPHQCIYSFLILHGFLTITTYYFHFLFQEKVSSSSNFHKFHFLFYTFGVFLLHTQIYMRKTHITVLHKISFNEIHVTQVGINANKYDSLG